MASANKVASGIASHYVDQDSARDLASSIERALNEAYKTGWHSGIQYHINTAPKRFWQKPKFQFTLVTIILFLVPLALSLGLHHGKR